MIIKPEIENVFLVKIIEGKYARQYCPYSQGDRFWYNKKGQLHRLDGPSIEYNDRTKKWYKNGQLHRINGPAIECADGEKHWYINGKCHRVTGPAIEWKDGSSSWYKNDKLHRLDGPAIEWKDANPEFYVNGTRYSELKNYIKEVEKYISKRKLFILRLKYE